MVRRKPNHLTAIMDVLVATERQETLERATRFFEFASLLRWPRDPKSAGIAARIMLARFVADTFDGLAAENQAHYLPTLLQHANPSVIIPDFISEESAFVMLDLGDTAEQDLVANIIRFLISYVSDNVDRRKGASIKKAYYLLQQGALYGQEPRSWKGFSEAWAAYKDVGAFLFVRRYSFSGSLAPDPRSPDFLGSVHRVLDDQIALRKFFAQSKWAVARLQAVLDSRALKDMHLPTFPDELNPIPLPTSPPTTRMTKLLHGYRASAG